MTQLAFGEQGIIPSLEKFVSPEDHAVPGFPNSPRADALEMYGVWTREPGSRSDTLIQVAQELGKLARPMDVYAETLARIGQDNITVKHGRWLAREAIDITSSLYCDYQPGVPHE